jgi:hypothetical protein
VPEPSEWSGGPSDIEGKTTRVGASECGQRTSFNRTRVAGHLDEFEGAVASTLSLLRNGAVGFIDWLDVLRNAIGVEVLKSAGGGIELRAPKRAATIANYVRLRPRIAGIGGARRGSRKGVEVN